MAFDVEAAKAEGYTDEEIAAYLRGQKGEPVPQQEQPGRGAEIAATVAAPVAGTVASYLPEALTLGATYYGLKKFGPSIAENAGKLYERFKGVNPTTSGTAAVGTPTNPIGAPTNVPVQGPVAPQSVPVNRAPTSNVIRFPGTTAAPVAQPAETTMLDKASQMIRQLAANKAFQGAVRVGAGAAAALTPGNVGQDYMVPQSGRMRGMEINPITGRPWTREELQAYAANPSAFDQQLGPAQMPR